MQTPKEAPHDKSFYISRYNLSKGPPWRPLAKLAADSILFWNRQLCCIQDRIRTWYRKNFVEPFDPKTWY
jgi:hypothetical protein